MDSPASLELAFDEAMVPSTDGVSIHTWFIPHRTRKRVPTVVFLHGNAGHMGFRLPNMARLLEEVDCNVVMMDYRGYGDSTGSALDDRGPVEDVEVRRRAA